ncbi:MAG TPA: DUF2339 domain-containing protein [Blastocatellia bacterium]
MEFLFAISLLLILPAAALLIVCLAKIGNLSRNVEHLNEDVSRLRRQIEMLSQQEGSGQAADTSISGAETQPRIPTATARETARRPQEPIGRPEPSLIPGRASTDVTRPPVPLTPAAGPPPRRGPDAEGPIHLPSQPRAPIPVQAKAEHQSYLDSIPVDMPPRAAKASPPSAPQIEWESLIGGRLLNWIGAIATIIGIGFFLRYAFQNNWITPPARVGIGLLAGFVALGGGGISYKKGFRIFSQGLIGAGISILYLSVYASFNFYHLVPQHIAFLMMSAVTTITFLQAFKFNSLAVSILGWAGGFLTPFLLSNGQSNEVGLFTYIVLLDAGLLAMAALKKEWVALEPLTLAATYVVYVLWYSSYYAPSDLGTTALFVTTFWALFMVLDVFWLVRKPDSLVEAREITGIFSTAFYFSALYVIVDSTRHDLTGLITMILGAIYLSVVLSVRRIKWNGFQFNRYLLTAIVFFILAAGFQFSGFTLVVAWSIEAVILVYSAAHWKLRPVLVAAVILYGVAIVALFGTYGWDHYGSSADFTLLLNPRTLAFAALAGSSAAAAIILGVLDKEKTRATRSVLHSTWCILVFVMITVELNDEFGHIMLGTRGDNLQSLAFEHRLIRALVWVLFSLPLVWYGLESKILPMLLSGLGALTVSAIQLVVSGAVYEPLAGFHLILNIRAAIFGASLAALLINAVWLRDHYKNYEWGKFALGFVFALWCILLFVLCTSEARDYLSATTVTSPGSEDLLTFKELMILSVVWSVYGVGLSALGRKRKIMPFVASAGLALCLGVIVAIAGGYRYHPIDCFVPVYNLRAVCLILVIACLVVLSRSIGAAPSGATQSGLETSSSFPDAKESRILLAITISLMIVFLLSVETKDYFGRELFVLNQTLNSLGPFGRATDHAALLSAEIHSTSNFQQMALSLVWVGYSIVLISYGIWRRSFALRLLAIILVSIAILKIFFYDLSFLETGYRIVSFIGLGLILLAISFLYQRFKSVISGTEAPGEG